MAYLAADAIWTAIAERIEGVNTIAPRAMPSTGVDYIRCDRVEGSDVAQRAERSIAGPIASIAIEADRSPNTTPTPSTLVLYDLKITVRVTYNIASQANAAATYQSTKSIAQRHMDQLTQALCYPGVLLVTQANGTAYDGTTLAAGTATGIISGMLYPGPATIISDAEGFSDIYEINLAFTAQAMVSAAIA